MNKNNLLLLLSCFMLVLSCKKTDSLEVQSPESINKENPVYQYIKQLGFKDSDIKENAQSYIVDGDIVFNKKQIINSTVFKKEVGPTEEQYGTSNYIGYNIQPNITVRIDPSASSITNEINSALAIWNSVSNFRIRLTLLELEY